MKIIGVFFIFIVSFYLSEKHIHDYVRNIVLNKVNMYSTFIEFLSLHLSKE